jgi:hypothetical protein
VTLALHVQVQIQIEVENENGPSHFVVFIEKLREELLGTALGYEIPSY